MNKFQQWAVLTAAAVTAVLAVGWFLVVGPLRGEAAALTEQAAQEQAATASLVGQLQMLRGQAAELPAKQARLAELKAALPDQVRLPDLVRQLTSTAGDTGVKLVSLTPGSVTSVGPYSQVPVTLEVTGGFFNVEQFVAALEDLPRAFVVTGFTLAPTDANKPDSLRLTVNGQVFTTAAASDGTAPAPAAAGATAPAPAASGGSGTAPAASPPADGVPADGQPVDPADTAAS